MILWRICSKKALERGNYFCTKMKLTPPFQKNYRKMTKGRSNSRCTMTGSVFISGPLSPPSSTRSPPTSFFFPGQCRPPSPPPAAAVAAATSEGSHFSSGGGGSRALPSLHCIMASAAAQKKKGKGAFKVRFLSSCI